MDKGIGIGVDLRSVSAQLRGTDKKFAAAVRREIRLALSQAGADMVGLVREAASWSSRIPDAVSVKTSFSATRGRAEVIVDAKKAPEARPLEGAGKGTFRHPVFGSDTWVEQQTHPFFFPAAAQVAPQVSRDMEAALDKIARDAGFH